MFGSCLQCLQSLIISNTELRGPKYAIYFQYSPLRCADWADSKRQKDKFDRDLTWTVRCIDSIVSMPEKNSLISTI